MNILKILAIKNKSIFITIVFVFLAGIFLSLYFTGYFSKATTSVQVTPYIVPALTKEYSNKEYKFSLMMPQDFVTRETNIDGYTTIVFENSRGEGIQIYVSEFDESLIKTEKGVKIFDASYIQKNIQDMKIIDAQHIEVGSGYRGVAFKSDNEAFDSASREVWFVFQGNLYQISTYERFDELLKEMFVTWKFN